MAGIRVLLVDAQAAQREALAHDLARQGVEVSAAEDIRGARDAVIQQAPDIVVLDVDLEDLGGFGLLSSIVNDSDVPVIVLTDRAEEPLRLLGFELGADDYVVKPCSPLELASRIRTVLRRMGGRRRAAGAVVSGDLVLDPSAREATLAGEPVTLTSREFDLLAYLVAHSGQVCDRQWILRDVWRSTPDWQDPSTVTEHVRRLRQQLEADPANPTRILTVRGRGYRWAG
jgi:DNA-binding response OmpR family regulator